MLDYHEIDYIIRRKNFSLWKVSDDLFDIIKNEHGTYGEHNDFVVSVKIDSTYKVIGWSLAINNDKIIDNINDIVKSIKNIMKYQKNIQFEELCVAIANKL